MLNVEKFIFTPVATIIAKTWLVEMMRGFYTRNDFKENKLKQLKKKRGIYIKV